jgi:phosphatidylserine decarboxylase
MNAKKKNNTVEIINTIEKFCRDNFVFHKEGKTIILSLLVNLVIINGILYLFSINDYIYTAINIISFGILAVVFYFFRNPEREVLPDNNAVYAPADGKVVAIEETYEDEYLKENSIQVSIFMSPLNVHVNRVPVCGKIKYVKYHPGNYLVAWHPKSSSYNERTSVVIETQEGHQLLLRQIAGAVARRIVCYATEGGQVAQGEDLGFIRFGSRVDTFLPLNAEITVKIGQIVAGNKTVIARLK